MPRNLGSNSAQASHAYNQCVWVLQVPRNLGVELRSSLARMQPMRLHCVWVLQDQDVLPFT